MKKLYVSYGTEYEQGWGQRPDGFILSLSLDNINMAILKLSTGSPEYYWRYSEPKEVFMELKDFKKLKFDKEGIYHGSENDKINIFNKN